MATKQHYVFLLTFAALVGSPTLRAVEPLGTDTAIVTALSEIRPTHEGKDATMIFKITKTQPFFGDRDGEYPHVLLHFDGMEAGHFYVRAKGDVADALHRFACIGPKERLIGRSIKASGKIQVDFPLDGNKPPIYNLNLTDWKSFQILPETEGK